MLAARVSVSARAPSNDARRTNADRRGSTCSTRSPSADADDPVADGDIGTEVADPSRLTVVAAGQQRAPPSVDARDTRPACRTRRAPATPLPSRRPSRARPAPPPASHCHERAVTDVLGNGG